MRYLVGVYVGLQCNMTTCIAAAIVQLTVNMCTCPENSTGAHKDINMHSVVEAAYSLKGYPCQSQTTNGSRPHCSSVV